MALVSVQGSAEAAANTVDAYLPDISWQAAEANHPTSTIRYARLAAFLAFVGLVTAALAVLVSLPDDGSVSAIPQSCIALGAIGLLVSIALSAQEIRAGRTSDLRADPDAAAYATASIYHASAGFFAVIVVISAALLLVR